MAEHFIQQGGSNQDEIDRLNAAASMIGPLSSRSRWTVGLLIAGMVGSVAGLVAGAWQRSLLSEVLAGRTISLSEAEAADAIYALTGLVQFGIFVGTVIAFLMWFQMAYSSLPSLGALDLPYKRGWAAGAWFIPVFSLYAPKQIANAIYRASDYSLPRRPGTHWKDLGVSPLLHVWWGFWILGNVASWGSFVVTGQTAEESLQQVNRITFADFVTLISGALAIAVVRLLTKRIVARTTVLLKPRADSPTGPPSA